MGPELQWNLLQYSFDNFLVSSFYHGLTNKNYEHWFDRRNTIAITKTPEFYVCGNNMTTWKQNADGEGY